MNFKLTEHKKAFYVWVNDVCMLQLEAKTKKQALEEFSDYIEDTYDVKESKLVDHKLVREQEIV